MKQIAGTAVMSIEDLKTLLFPIKKRTRNVKPLTIEQHEAMLERMKNMRKISLETRKRKKETKEKKEEMKNNITETPSINELRNITETPSINELRNKTEDDIIIQAKNQIIDTFENILNHFETFEGIYNCNLLMTSDQIFDLETKYNNLLTKLLEKKCEENFNSLNEKFNSLNENLNSLNEKFNSLNSK